MAGWFGGGRRAAEEQARLEQKQREVEFKQERLDALAMLARQEASDREKAEAAEREAAEYAVQQEHTENVVRAFFGDALNVLKVQREFENSVFEETTLHSNVDFRKLAGDRYSRITDEPVRFEHKMHIQFELSRSLSSMKKRHTTIAQYVSLFGNYGFINVPQLDHYHTALIFDDAHCEIKFLKSDPSPKYMQISGIKTPLDAVKFALSSWKISTADAAVASFITLFSSFERQQPDHHIVKEFRDLLIGGTGWLSDPDFPVSPFTFDRSRADLFVGATMSGRKVWHHAEGSLITIAPPGSGKTQCHVFPNLLSYEGPAVVLDVKGECYEQTSAWRRENVGPVFRFNPLNPAVSARYNPLAFIENDPETLWEECKLIAELLLVPTSQTDATWELRARDVITGTMAWLVRTLPPAHRTMGKIIDVVSRVFWDEFLESARTMQELPALVRLATGLAKVPERQLEGILDAARRHLGVWEGTRVERVTAACDWTPAMLRDGSNTTIYICIPANEIESYGPLLRVIFAQHLRQLLKELPPRGQTPILFMLDELPRLGTMKPVEEAHEVGRQYGIRLWMFVQSIGQLQGAYKNADGIIGSCAARIYMNPSAHDGTAKNLSEELGYIESIIDGSRNLLVEASDLTGPDFADLQIARARNTRPAKLKKIFAYQDAEFASRMPGGSSCGEFRPEGT